MPANNGRRRSSGRQLRSSAAKNSGRGLGRAWRSCSSSLRSGQEGSHLYLRAARAWADSQRMPVWGVLKEAMRRLLPVLSLVAALLAAPAAASARPHNLLTGFTDDAVFLETRSPTAKPASATREPPAARSCRSSSPGPTWRRAGPRAGASRAIPAGVATAGTPWTASLARRARLVRLLVTLGEAPAWAEGRAALQCAAGQLATLGFRVPRLRPGRRPPLLGQLRRAASGSAWQGWNRPT